MAQKRRTIVKRIGLLCVAAIGFTTTTPEAASWAPVIEGKIRVEDEAGVPIPYVTVWSAVEQPAEHTRATVWPAAHLGIADLWRVTQRYGALHDIISSFGDKPVPYLGIPPMGNAEGTMDVQLDYQNETGKGNSFARPDPLTFGYTFLKRGYLPGRVAFTVDRKTNHVEATVKLVRNSSETVESPSYLQAFDRIRYQLSYDQKNKVQTSENERRLVLLRDQLEQAARQAVAAGDRGAAARIYSRMRYLPSLNIMNGQIAGYNQADPTSAQARHALDLAYQLDPENLYVWMHTYGRQAAFPPNASREDRIRVNLPLLEKMIAANGEKIWPLYYSVRASSYASLGDYTTARRLYLEVKKMEPKYDDWDSAIEDLKLKMKISGVAASPPR